MGPASGSGDGGGAAALAVRRRYVNFTGFPFPLTPLLSRRTVMEEVIPGQVWQGHILVYGFSALVW